MKGVPAVRARCASCMSVVVFPRPAGPSRTIRRPCDSAWSICSSDSVSADSAPFGSSRTAESSNERMSFGLASPGSGDSGGCASRPDNEARDLRITVNFEVDEAGPERLVLRRQH